MQIQTKRCYNCMNFTDDDGICKHCGFDNNSYQIGDALSVQSILNARFLVGARSAHNDEFSTYIGFDTQEKCVVTIYEYYPLPFAKRCDDQKHIVSTEGNDVAFKILKSDYYELSNQQQKLNDLTCVENVICVFEENGTVYKVCKNYNSVKISDVIENGSFATWEALSEPLLKFIYQLQLMHARAIIHKGISLETVKILPHYGFLLTQFATDSLRCTSNDLNQEMFEGYTAPEQYNNKIRNGTFSDIYSLGAVIFSILSGKTFSHDMYPDIKQHILEVNPSVPSHVIAAIIFALEPDSQRRTKTMRDLAHNLSNPDFEEQIAKPEKEVEAHHTSWTLGKTVAVTISILLALLIIVIGIIFIPPLFEPDTPVVVPGYVDENQQTEQSNTIYFLMPNLVGQDLYFVSQNQEYKSLFGISASQQYDDNYQKGQIIAQSIPPDEKLEIGTDIIVDVIVSRGTQYPTVPQFSGMLIDDYRQILENIGFVVTPVPDVTTNLENREVCKVEPSVGTKVDLESDKNITVYYVDKTTDTPPIPY